VRYREFRTGLTFADVRRMLQAEQRAKAESGERMYVTRKTVLGRWHSLKKQAWNHYRKHGAQ
jgi:hypothetical protein